jgi:radical SAM superfamily enzyme YgiQ (UPF0313 family)
MKAAASAGEGRARLFDLLAAHPSVWLPGKDKVTRHIYEGFSTDLSPAVFPIANIKTVHNHGAVEIMRGCPNACKFCQAGVWYKPVRKKSIANIRAEVRAFVEQGGYNEISLSSLSSGDYGDIDGLLDALIADFKGCHVSFQLPSLRVSSFSLATLEKISEVRKSGLTFAVETPDEAAQHEINKVVTLEMIVPILREAKQRGFHGAKFYFMIGLPVSYGEVSEEEAIVRFVETASAATRMKFNVSVNIFIPKRHTAFENAVQLDGEVARQKLNFIRDRLKKSGHKVSVHDVLTARIEGLLSRGDEKAGALVEEAFHRGARLDAWHEFLKRDIWEELLLKTGEVMIK